MSDIAKGDKVRLKSGGPVMVVDDIGDYSPMGVSNAMQAKCSWFDVKHKRFTEVFELHSLEAATPPAIGAIRLTRA